MHNYAYGYAYRYISICISIYISMQVYKGPGRCFSESAFIVVGMDLGCIRDVSGNSKGVWALARAQITYPNKSNKVIIRTIIKLRYNIIPLDK